MPLTKNIHVPLGRNYEDVFSVKNLHSSQIIEWLESNVKSTRVKVFHRLSDSRGRVLNNKGRVLNSRGWLLKWSRGLASRGLFFIFRLGDM